MFTGLIREFAEVKSFKNNFLSLKSSYTPKIGDSIAVNGACLTVVEVKKGEFTVELSFETMDKIAIENLKGLVHIEPAMKLNDRVEGHIVQGHIDTIGIIEKIEKKDRAFDFYISLSKEYMKYVVEKGSIAVDGVSLTVNDVFESSFRLTIIPHTMQKTLFNSYFAGRRVNIETDMFARYIYHIFKKEKNLSWNEIDKIMAIY